MVSEKAVQLPKKDDKLPEARQTKNDSSHHTVHFDLCKLQDEERERKLKHRENRFKRKVDNNKDLCHQRVPIEPDPTTNEYNQFLTDTDRSWIITHTQNHRRRQKNVQDYLRKNHEIFTLQYTLDVKQNEIERLENLLRQEERTLIKAEKHIGEDLALFDQFLDAWSRSASDAAARADEESWKKEELVNEIKRLQKSLITYHNDQNRLTDTLKQSRRYQQFLFKFAPKEWRDEVVKRLESISTNDKSINNTESSKMISPSIDRSDITSTSSDTHSYISPNEDYSLYFTKPSQLLDIFTEMEEKSLPLVEKSQHTSEILDKMHSTIKTTTLEQNYEVEQLQLKVNQLDELIKHEIQREISCQNILIQYKTAKDDLFNEQIKTTIEILYKKHMISDHIGISTISILQTIENKIKSLFNIIEQTNSSTVIEAEKFREIAIRTMERQEKIREEKKINELKHQKALLRASAPPYSKIGRIIMERSRPLFEKKFQIKHSIINKQEQLIRLLENDFY